MSEDQIIGARVSSETKSQFRALALRQQISESALLKRLVDIMLGNVGPLGEQVLGPDRGVRRERVWVRLRPEDRLLLGERAANRGMAAATYVSALVRSHLRQIAPLPTAELDLMKRSVAELRAISHHLDQVVRAANGGARPAALNNGNAQVMLKVCEGLLDHVKALIKANLKSWDLGYADPKK